MLSLVNRVAEGYFTLASFHYFFDFFRDCSQTPANERGNTPHQTACRRHISPGDTAPATPQGYLVHVLLTRIVLLSRGTVGTTLTRVYISESCVAKLACLRETSFLVSVGWIFSTTWVGRFQSTGQTIDKGVFLLPCRWFSNRLFVSLSGYVLYKERPDRPSLGLHFRVSVDRVNTPNTGKIPHFTFI